MRRKINDGWRFRRKDSIQWSEIALPHAAREEGFVYKRFFRLEDGQLKKQVALLFTDMPRDAMVFVNGKRAKAMGRQSAISCFSCKGLARAGENILRIETAFPLRSEAWLIVKEPGTPMPADVDIETVVAHPAKIRIHAQRECMVFVLDGFDVMAQGYGKDVELTLPSARPWTLEDPCLYTVVAGGEMFDVGFRWTAIERDVMMLNGKPMILKGFLVDPRDWRNEDIEKRVAWMKEAGFTAVKSTGTPFIEAFLNACDKNGLLAVEEAKDESLAIRASRHPSLVFPCQREGREGIHFSARGNGRMEKIVSACGEHVMGVFMRATWDGQGNPGEDAILARAVLCRFEKPQPIVCFGKETEGKASWTWPGREGNHCLVKVFSAAPFVALLINGRHVDAKALKHYKAVFSIRYEPGELKLRSLDKRGDLIGATIIRTQDFN